MDDEKEPPRETYDQASRVFDDAPSRFRKSNSGEDITGGSGVLFEQAMSQTRMAICLSDPNMEDAPIVFANRAFIELTGYPEEEIIGRNCRFLQGPDTDAAAVAQIRRALDAEEVTVVELLNYRKNGEAFWNALHLGPIYDETGKLIYYFGSQWDVTEVTAARSEERHAKMMARELSHRIKNMFSVMGGIVTLTGKKYGDIALARRINERIQALGRAHEATLDEASRGEVDASAAIESVLSPYAAEGTRITFSGEPAKASPSIISTLGLVLNELATNAVKYGALSNEDGVVAVAWSRESDVLTLTWAEKGGPPVAEPKSGRGSSIVDMLLAAINSSIEREWREDGLVATVRIDLTEGA